MIIEDGKAEEEQNHDEPMLERDLKLVFLIQSSTAEIIKVKESLEGNREELSKCYEMTAIWFLSIRIQYCNVSREKKYYYDTLPN